MAASSLEFKPSNRKTRPIAKFGNIGIVQLTQGHTAIIDVDDIALVSQWNWRYSSGGGERKAYPATGINGRTIRLHNILLPAREGFVVDHIDCDTFNNRRSNLRYATEAENRRNRHIGGREGRKGVYFQKSKGNYTVRLHIGDFTSFEEAVSAYDQALMALFPEFGRPNTR